MLEDRKIELLSPAKNIDVGISAINHGADAVYIGPSHFGARVAAGNSVADIEKLAAYAHQYYAKVYVTLNTILKDDELESARKLVYELYDAGADALIVQDMSLLEMDIPPIALHASTQCDTRTVDKVKFLEDCGFEQVVLARETSIETMKKMAAETNVSLEAFIHGALCVCYSGQCYMSEAVMGRSANRGACAQMCRLPYDLINDKGEVLMKNKHLLSLKDFDASHCLREMIEAGISSFKIEGRLKDVNYVKNITAYYRKLLDTLLEGTSHYLAASSGTTKLFFNPNPEKTFYRGATDYFLKARRNDISSFDTPKSLGEPIGKVKDIWRNALSIDTHKILANGDGLCFLNQNGIFEGFRINKVETNRVLPLKMPLISKGVLLYRNSDMAFDKILSGKTAERKIKINVNISDTKDGFALHICDEDGINTKIEVKSEHIASKNEEKCVEIWKKQFVKLGDTIFECSYVNIEGMNDIWFVPVSKIAEWRRELIVKHIDNRRKEYKRSIRKKQHTSHDYVSSVIDYRGNVYNDLAEKFYERHNCKVKERAFECTHNEDAELMRTKYCLRYALGICNKSCKDDKYKQLYIQHGKDKFSLSFDCKNCEMVIKKVKN